MRKTVRTRRPGPPPKKAPKAKRAKPKNIERTKQITLATLLRLHYPDVLWFHIPNGGKRNMKVAKQLKDMGTLPGVHDIFISEPTPVYPGMYIEMKGTPTDGLTDEQIKFKIRAQHRGFYVVDHCDALQALADIEQYLGIPKGDRVAGRLSI